MENVEPSRDKERYKHIWRLPTGMNREQALNYFVMHIKPRHDFVKFGYNPMTGVAESYECRQ